jgi:hypothetical protein
MKFRMISLCFFTLFLVVGIIVGRHINYNKFKYELIKTFQNYQEVETETDLFYLRQVIADGHGQASTMKKLNQWFYADLIKFSRNYKTSETGNTMVLSEDLTILACSHLKLEKKMEGFNFKEISENPIKWGAVGKKGFDSCYRQMVSGLRSGRCEVDWIKDSREHFYWTKVYNIDRSNYFYFLTSLREKEVLQVIDETSSSDFIITLFEIILILLGSSLMIIDLLKPMIILKRVNNGNKIQD